MRGITVNHSRIAAKTLTIGCGLLLLGSTSLAQEVDTLKADTKDGVTLTLLVGHRVWQDFREVHRTEMHKREPIGDTELTFEVLEFYPHFAYVDSLKEIVSLSDEPKNVAFRIAVYENDEVIQKDWAFYNMSAPHFRRDSIIWFSVVEFEYRGEVYKRAPEETHEKAKEEEEL